MTVSNVIKALKDNGYVLNTSSYLSVNFYLGPANFKVSYKNLGYLDEVDCNGGLLKVVIEIESRNKIIFLRRGREEKTGYWEPTYYLACGDNGKVYNRDEREKVYLKKLREKIDKIEVMNPPSNN